MSTKTTIIQTIQIETDVNKNNSNSDDINRDRCLQKHLYSDNTNRDRCLQKQL